jgi:hypothetical protein
MTIFAGPGQASIDSGAGDRWRTIGAVYIDTPGITGRYAAAALVPAGIGSLP